MKIRQPKPRRRRIEAGRGDHFSLIELEYNVGINITYTRIEENNPYE